MDVLSHATADAFGVPDEDLVAGVPMSGDEHGPAFRVLLQRFLGADTLRQVLSLDSDTDWCVVDFSGAMLYASVRSAIGVTRPSGVAAPGTEKQAEKLTLRGSFHADMWAEQLRLVRAALGRREPIVVRGFRRGFWTRTVFRPLFGGGAPGPSGKGGGRESEGVVLCTSVPLHRTPTGWAGGSPAACERILCHDFGDLAVLTGREFEVLKLVGHGLSIEQIAKSLARSPNTVTVHRRALGSKLGIARVGGLGSFAVARGLTAMSDEEVAGVVACLGRSVAK